MAAIKTVAVIGAARLGRDIALAVALAGYRTILEDILPASLRRAQDQIRDSLNQSIQSGTICGDAAAAALARLEYAGSVEEAARQADLVIEAVPDEMESKLEIFTLLDKIARPHTILASTTNALRVSDIASITFRAERVVGLRLSAPAAGMEQFKIVRFAGTSDETVAACAEIGGRMGRDVVVDAEANAGG